MNATTSEPVVIARDSFTCPLGDFSRGQTVRASDPAVIEYPDLFAPDGTLDEELGSPFDHVVALRAEREAAEREAAERAFLEEAKANRVRLTLPPTVKCMHEHAAIVDGRVAWIEKGSQALADAPYVRDHPEHWR